MLVAGDEGDQGMLGRRQKASVQPTRLLIGLRQEDLGGLLAEFLFSVRAVATSKLGCTAGWDRTGDILSVGVPTGGQLVISPANLESPILRKLYPNGELAEGYVVHFSDLPRKSKIDDTYVRTFFSDVVGSIQVKLDEPRVRELAAGLTPRDFVLSLL